jgi:transposase InsO family protein
VKYTWIYNNCSQYSISKLCDFSNITRSSYYSWLEVQQSKQNDSFIFIEDQKLKTLIPKVFKEYHGHGGARRIKKWLMKAHDLQVSRRRICRLLLELGLTVKPITKFKNKNVTPINDARIAKNHLQRGFNPLGPNQKWVSDITYIKTGQGWLFLVVFIDLYSRRVVGWSADSHMRAELVTQALLMAIWNRKPSKGLIIHTDQGSQYTSDKYLNVLNYWGMMPSMSRRGNCWDNAVAESFFASLKKERVYDNQYLNRREALFDIADYIGWYNHDRMHSTLDYESPEDYEQAYKTQISLLEANN